MPDGLYADQPGQELREAVRDCRGVPITVGCKVVRHLSHHRLGEFEVKKIKGRLMLEGTPREWVWWELSAGCWCRPDEVAVVSEVEPHAANDE